MRKPAVFAGVDLTSLCVLMLQLALTRLFSATMHYHFAFLAIALALFGSGATGVLLTAAILYLVALLVSRSASLSTT